MKLLPSYSKDTQGWYSSPHKAEVFSRLNQLYRIDYFSLYGGPVTGSTNTKVQTKKIEEIEQNDILVIPGGWGTLQLVNDGQFIKKLHEAAAGRQDDVHPGILFRERISFFYRSRVVGGKES